MQELNKHLHETLKWLPRLSAARVTHHCEGAFYSLSKSGAICWPRNKKGKERGPCLVNDLFIEPRKLFPSEMIFFLGSIPSIFLRPGNICFSPPCIFQWFPLLHDKPFTSIYSACISAGLPLLRKLCRSTTQNWCFVSPQELNSFSSKLRPSPPPERSCEKSNGEQRHLWLVMSTVCTQMTF